MAQLVTDITIQNLKGLHARATALFVKTAEQFSSEILIKNAQGIEVSGKSIMGILMLGVPLGDTVTLTITGDDAQEAMDTICALINNRFGED